RALSQESGTRGEKPRRADRTDPRHVAARGRPPRGTRRGRLAAARDGVRTGSELSVLGSLFTVRPPPRIPGIFTPTRGHLEGPTTQDPRHRARIRAARIGNTQPRIGTANPSCGRMAYVRRHGVGDDERTGSRAFARGCAAPRAEEGRAGPGGQPRAVGGG